MANRTSKGKKSNKTKVKKSRKKTSPVSEEKRMQIRRMQENRKHKKRLYDLLWGIAFVAIGIFIFVAMQFNAAGSLGNGLATVIKGILGHIGYVFPWYMIIIGCLLVFGKSNHFTWKTFLGFLIILVAFCLLNSARFIYDDLLELYIVNFYIGGTKLEGGGVLGMSIGVLLIKLIGRAGLYIFSIAIILVCILITMNTPISVWMEKLHNRREEKRLLQAHDDAEEDEAADNYFEAAPFSQEESGKIKKAKSNIMEFMTRDKQFGVEPESKTSEAKPVSDPILRGYGLEGSEAEQVDIDNYENKQPSKKEIAENAAKIGAELGLGAGDKALTKAVDKNITAEYKKPSLELLNLPSDIDRSGISKSLKEKARLLEKTMHNFNVDAKVVQVTQGPAVTRYEIQPNTGVKVSKIVGLSDDIALNLRAKSIRMEAPIPGKAAVGIEVENEKINMVTLREIIDSKEFKEAPSKIEFAVGKDIAGKPIVANLKDMPHLLIAGSTGSGKSVCINSIITSLLYKAGPDEVKLVLIDPKVVELGNYNGIPHLLIPVVTEPSKAAAALNWAVVEMTNRYKLFAEENVKDLASYNAKMIENGNSDLFMPQIVIIIDELADLMMAAPNQVEDSICRLAQMARAAGMHLIVATQRPSVDIITGLIKANIPSRIAFAVSSQADSRTILDRGGAEHLVGKGDMLFNPLGVGTALRVQGTFVSDKEVQRVIDHVKNQVDEIEYADEVIDTIENSNIMVSDNDNDADELLPEAIECVVMQGQASTSMIQRRFRVGYNRAARIVDQMEARGIVGAQDGARPRQVLISEEEFEELYK